jgi:hypothetical protein
MDEDTLPSLDAQLAIADSKLYAYETGAQRPHETIAALIQHIADLKTRRNAHTSALVRLPPEIIACILHFAQCAADSSWNIRTPWLDLDSDWMRLMLVCRRLRAVALDTPHLWTVLHCGTPAWLKLCISRAKGAPLDLCGAGFSDLVDEEDEGYAGPELARHVLNARRLCMPMPQRPHNRFTTSILDHPLPHIDALHLVRGSPRAIQWPHFLSPDFLGGHSNTLRTLTLGKVAFADTDGAPSFPALVRLDVQSSYISREAQSVRQLVALLRGVPRLERLAVRFGGATGHGAYESIPLRYLQTLALEGGVEDLETFTGLLPLPSHHLSLVCDEPLSGASAEAPLIATVQRFWATGPLPPVSLVLEAGQINVVFGALFELDDPGSAPRLFAQFEMTSLFHMRVTLDTVQLVVIKRVRTPRDLPPDLMVWLAERNGLECVEFFGCERQGDTGGEMRAYAEQLRASGLVSRVLWK